MKRLILALTIWLALGVNCFAQLPKLIHASASNGTTCSLSVTSGHTLMVSSGWFFSGTAPAVTDSVGTAFTWTQRYYDYNTHLASVGQATYTAPITATESHTVSFAVSGSSNNSTICEEWDLGGISTTVDSSQVAGQNSVNSKVTPNLTTTYNGELLHVLCQVSNNIGIWALSPEKFIGYGNGSDGFASSYEISGSPTTYSSTCKIQSGSANMLVSMTAFSISTTTTPVITSTALPDAIKSDAYSYQVTAQGGNAALTYSITAGALPLGLSMSSGGLITGTPTNSNPNTITIQASDGTHTGTANFTLHVGNSANTITHVQDANSSGVFGSNVTSGNLIVMPVQTNSSSGVGIPLCTDSLGTSFSYFDNVTADNGSSGPQRQAYLVGLAPSTGADTVSCDRMTKMLASEFSNAQNFFDYSNRTTGTSGSTITSSSLTTPATNALLYSGATASPNVLTPSAPCNTIVTGANSSCYQVATSITGYTVSYTDTSSTSWEIFLSAFRPTANGTAPALSSGYPVIY